MTTTTEDTYAGPTHRTCGRRHRPFTPCPEPSRDDDRDVAPEQ